MTGRKPWSEISAHLRKDPARAARIAEGARTMILISDLTKLRESRDLTQTELASALDAAVSRLAREAAAQTG